MTKFKIGMRVKIVPQAICVAPPPATKLQTRMSGKYGVVTQVLSDGTAWVRMDEYVPDDVRMFPSDDHIERGNYLLIWPSECVEIK